MTKIISAFAATLIATASFAGAAAAGGDYYEGVSKDRASVSIESNGSSARVDRLSTGSIDDQVRQPTSRDNREFAVDHGDFYQGVNRPN